VLSSMLLVGLVVLGQAGPAAEDDLRLEVRSLVRQLDAPQLGQREAAEKELTALGPKVLDLLPQTTDRTSAEVKLRLGRVRQKLQRMVAESAAKGSPVTLRGEALPLCDVFATIQEQTGNKVVFLPGRVAPEQRDRKVNVDFDEMPFWQALDRVLDQAELTVYPFGEERAISVVGRTGTHAARSAGASYSGPFRFEPARVIARRELREPAESLQVVLEIAWEPRLAPISLKQRLAELEVVDDRGQTLDIDARQAVLEVPVNPEATAVELTLPLVLPSRDVKEIALLKGTLRALLPGRVETFRFDDLIKARNVDKQAAGVAVTLEQVRRNEAIWEVRVRVRFDRASGALESHRGWIFNNPAYLEGPDGKPIPNDGFETTRRTEDELGIAYLFELEGPPAGLTFVYKTPGTIIATGFDYEIKGLKLP